MSIWDRIRGVPRAITDTAGRVVHWLSWSESEKRRQQSRERTRSWFRSAADPFVRAGKAAADAAGDAAKNLNPFKWFEDFLKDLPGWVQIAVVAAALLIVLVLLGIGRDAVRVRR